MTRRDHILIAEATAGLIVALTIALTMLAHATDSGVHQWSEAAEAGVIVLLAVVVFTAVIGSIAVVLRLARHAAWALWRRCARLLRLPRRRRVRPEPLPCRSNALPGRRAGAVSDETVDGYIAERRSQDPLAAADEAAGTEADDEWARLLAAVAVDEAEDLYARQEAAA